MATIDELIAQGKLIRFKPLMEPGQMECRTVLVTPDVYDWCHSSRELGRQTPNPNAWDSLHAALTDFAVGALFYLDCHIKRLDRNKETDDTWEIKTRPPDAVRAFGWFHNKNVFVSTHCAMKKDLKDYQPHKQKVIDFRTLHACFYATKFGRLADAKEYFTL